MSNPKNDLYYTASILEFLARRTHNSPRSVALALGLEGIAQLFAVAEVDHCLCFEEVADELAERYQISEGKHDPLSSKPEDIRAPSVTAIGKNYAGIVESFAATPEDYPRVLFEVMSSQISDWMDDYHSAFFYSPTDYLCTRYESLLNGE